jgi:L-lactate dehydrogenase complex protein LldG
MVGEPVMSARDEILARVRAARPQAPVSVPRRYDAVDAVHGDLTELLVDRLVDYRATVQRTAGPGLAATIAAFLADATTVVAPDGVPDGWFDRPVVRDGRPKVLTVDDLDEPGLAVVTGCAVAIAVTGTLILDATPDQGRRLLTLVPDHHVCVVRADQIVAGVPAALRRIGDPTRPLTLVSGPSATSDIELDRVEGVHGPRRLDVVILD